VAFRLEGGGWQQLAVRLPARGALGILRLYLPASTVALQLDWIKITPAQGKAHRTDFCTENVFRTVDAALFLRQLWLAYKQVSGVDWNRGKTHYM
jgi:hypothetical protein